MSEENLEEKQEETKVMNEQEEKEFLMKKELEETTDRLKRLMAEFDNFKKRSTKEREGLYASLIADIATAFLPVLDNLEKAVEVQTTDESYKNGIELVLKQFKDVLTSVGVQKIESVGKPFDPEVHEAVSQVQDDSLGSQVIKEEFRAGYKIGNKVIRHSMVVVAN